MPHHKLDPKVAGLEKSATLAINERAARLRTEGRDVVRLGLGQSPFPVPQSVVAELQRHAHQKAYLPVEGLPELRAAIADHHRRTEGLDAEAGQVLVGPGTKELMFLLQLVYAGDLVIPAPSWVSYAPQARILGRDVHWLSTDFAGDLGVTPKALEELCRRDPDRARLLILNYPCNPTGASYSAERLAAIAEVCRRFGVLVLSDEIYSGLAFEGGHVSMARFYPEGTLVSNGLSKWCGAGGWRVGAFLFPKQLRWLQEAMAALASETFSCVSAPVQYAAVTAYRGGAEIDGYLARCRRVLKALMRHCARQLREAGATLCDPRGAFYLFPRFESGCARFIREGRPASSAELCWRILDETGVACLPGSDFGCPPSELFVRIAAVDFDGTAALDALATLPGESDPGEDFLRKFCQPSVDGVERLCAWLTDP